MRASRYRGGGTRSRFGGRRRPGRHIWLMVQGRRVWLPVFYQRVIRDGSIGDGDGIEIEMKKKVGL